MNESQTVTLPEESYRDILRKIQLLEIRVNETQKELKQTNTVGWVAAAVLLVVAFWPEISKFLGI